MHAWEGEAERAGKLRKKEAWKKQAWPEQEHGVWPCGHSTGSKRLETEQATV